MAYTKNLNEKGYINYMYTEEDRFDNLEEELLHYDEPEGIKDPTLLDQVLELLCEKENKTGKKYELVYIQQTDLRHVYQLAEQGTIGTDNTNIILGRYNFQFFYHLKQSLEE